ncbi:MAG TPA: helix-turn-helix transcriptional regulator [Micromonosporaceae bacterium]|nr:helix-turn-helix transcriptional regulator [Micromonosporaceae bacterium]
MFGSMIRAHRLRRAITQEELAHASGLSVRTIRDLEAGRIARPRQGTVRILADAFELCGDKRERFYTAALLESVPSDSRHTG